MFDCDEIPFVEMCLDGEVIGCSVGLKLIDSECVLCDLEKFCNGEK